VSTTPESGHLDLDALTALKADTHPAPWVVEYDSYRNDERWVVKADWTPIAFCDEKEEALTLAGLRNNWTALLSALTVTRAELEQARIDRDERLTLRESSDLAKMVDAARQDVEYWRGKYEAGAMDALAAAPKPDEDAPFECAPECRCGAGAVAGTNSGHCGLCASEDCPGVPGMGCMPGPFEAVDMVGESGD
jgi:hypothetical protein